MAEQIALLVVPAFMVIIVTTGLCTRTPVYEAFIRGAKQGFAVAVKIIPYVVAFMVAVAVFRAGGGFDLMSALLSPVLSAVMLPAEVLPLVVARPFSGGASLGVLGSIISECGPDSYPGVLASVIMGSSETLFYTIALYYGSVGVKRTRHTVISSLIAEVAGLAAAIIAVNLLFSF